MEMFIGVLTAFSIINFIAFLVCLLAWGNALKKIHDIKPTIESILTAVNLYSDAAKKLNEAALEINLPNLVEKFSVIEKRLENIENSSVTVN